MMENELASIVVNSAMQIHMKLGPGLYENVYEAILAHELRKHGLSVAPEVSIPLTWDSLHFDVGFRADLIVNELLLLELKSVEALTAAHKKQVRTYLKITGLKLGLLNNFGEALLKDGIVRIVNGLPE